MRHIDIVACELRINGKPANTSQRIELFLAHPTYKHGLRSKCPTRLARVLNVLAGCLPCWPISPSADFSRLEFRESQSTKRRDGATADPIAGARAVEAARGAVEGTHGGALSGGICACSSEQCSW